MDYKEYLAAEDKQFRAHLEAQKEVIGGVLEEVKGQRDRIVQEAAQVVKASGKEAVGQARESLDQVAQAAKMVEKMAQLAVETTGNAAQRSADLLGRLDEASARMLTSEQAVEAALNALVPKVASLRGNLEQELGEAVRATAATEAEVKRLVATIRTSLLKEVEGEIRTKISGAAREAADRIYRIGSWWENFTRIGIYLAMGVLILVAWFLGWWFGRHQVEVDTYDKAVVAVQKNSEVYAYAYQFEKQDGKYVPRRVALDAPLACTVPGKFMSMTKNVNGQWVYGEAVVDPGTLLSAATWDTSDKDKWRCVKANRP